MSDHSTPGDVKGYTITVFIAFVAVFVFVMLMMLWQGDYEKNANGEFQYNTQVNEPSNSN